MFSDIKKPPVRNSKEADAVVALRPHFPMGYHLAQQQVGGTSVLSNAIEIVSNFWQIVNVVRDRFGKSQLETFQYCFTGVVSHLHR